jgi:hypothetical protein
VDRAVVPAAVQVRAAIIIGFCTPYTVRI